MNLFIQKQCWKKRKPLSHQKTSLSVSVSEQNGVAQRAQLSDLFEMRRSSFRLRKPLCGLPHSPRVAIERAVSHWWLLCDQFSNKFFFSPSSAVSIFSFSFSFSVSWGDSKKLCEQLNKTQTWDLSLAGPSPTAVTHYLVLVILFSQDTVSARMLLSLGCSKPFLNIFGLRGYSASIIYNSPPRARLFG